MKMDNQDIHDTKVSHLPSNINGILDCIRHEIHILEKEQQQQPQAIEENTDVEDALDDGFLCIDLSVCQKKLQIWHELFRLDDDQNDHKTQQDRQDEPLSSTSSSSRPPIVNVVTPYFAVKCHSDPMIMKVLTSENSSTLVKCGFDCASLYELQLAKQTSIIQNTPIIYANPQRAEKELQQALELLVLTSKSLQRRQADSNHPLQTSPGWLTVDGIEELYKIQKAMQQLKKQQKEQPESDHDDNRDDVVQLIIRILVPDEDSQVPLGEKFGCTLESIPTLVETALQLQLPIIGVSFHCGSGCHSPSSYQQALELSKQAMDIINSTIRRKQQQHHQGQHESNCWLLDIGGGFPGWDGLDGDQNRFSGRTKNCDTLSQDTAPVTPAPSSLPNTIATKDIANAIRNQLQEFHNQGITIIAEPGRYFVEGSACLASRIYKKEMVRNHDGVLIREYKIPHGVHGVFKDVLLCGESFVPIPLKQQGEGYGDFSLSYDNGRDQEQQQHEVLYPSRICGPMAEKHEAGGCCRVDIVCEHCQLPDLQVGDFLVFDRMGAYTISIASRTGQPVVRYVQGL